MLSLLKTMRPRQWTKNVMVFAPLVFDQKLLNSVYLGRTLVGFLLLCLASGAVYILNDLVDLEKDRQHPRKRQRPLASGALTPPLATVALCAISVITVVVGLLVDRGFAYVLVTYLLLQVAYSFWLKHIVILDVLVIAAGFVLRVAAGVPLVQAERFSPWLYVCMTFVALVFGFGKRRHELTLLRENANSHRRILEEYNLSLLDNVITVATTSALVSYAFYTFSAPNLPANHSMMLTIPFVLYAMFRYLYLIHVKGVGGAPEEIVLSDRPLQIAALLWALSAIVVMYADTIIGVAGT